jgi:Copper type II ascorbate-dependent monooxygenase, C-terminal domain
MKPSLPVLAACVALSACDSSSAPPEPSAPVYYGQVQRILQDNCVECHSASPDRLAPFSLASFEDAVAAADSQPLAFAVMTRAMPPYFNRNDGSCQDLTTKWLSDEEIETLTRWSNGARLAGDPAKAVPPPTPGPALAEIDATLDIGGDYTPNPAVEDDYRCFVVDALGASAAERFVVGSHVKPSNLSVAHHVIVFTLDTAAAESEVLAKDAADPGLGFACTGGGPAAEGTSFLVGWAPGNQAQLFPSGTGIPVPGDRKLVVQVHYNLSHSDGRADRTLVDLDLADAVTSRGAMVAVRGDVNLAPRSPDALAEGTRRLPAGIGALRIWGAMLHMHQRGTGAQVSVSGSTSACLASLDQWNFHWQHYYPYQQPVSVAGGDRLSVTCHYDTSNDSAPVRWGEGTADEMCLAYLYVSQ